MSTGSGRYLISAGSRAAGLWFLAAAVLFSVFLACPAHAFAGGEAVPVVVTAKTLMADNKARTVTYSGDVSVTRGRLRLTADEVVIRLVESGADRGGAAGSTEAMFSGKLEISDIEAEGGVKVVQDDKTAVSERAVYYTANETIVMEGSPRVWQGDSVLTGSKIIYNIKDDTIRVEDARTVIYTDGQVPGGSGSGQDGR